MLSLAYILYSVKNLKLVSQNKETNLLSTSLYRIHSIYDFLKLISVLKKGKQFQQMTMYNNTMWEKWIQTYLMMNLLKKITYFKKTRKLREVKWIIQIHIIYYFPVFLSLSVCVWRSTALFSR